MSAIRTFNHVNLTVAYLLTAWSLAKRVLVKQKRWQPTQWNTFYSIYGTVYLCKSFNLDILYLLLFFKIVFWHFQNLSWRYVKMLPMLPARQKPASFMLVQFEMHTHRRPSFIVFVAKVFPQVVPIVHIHISNRMYNTDIFWDADIMSKEWGKRKLKSC